MDIVSVLALILTVVCGSRHPRERALPNLHQAELPAAKPSSRWSGNSSSTDRAIVVARYTEDVSWLELYFPHIPHTVFQVGDKSTAYGSEKNVCKEAEAYLTYLIDHYHNLAASTVFVHGHRAGWHLRDKVEVLARLRWGQHGFANIRHANLSCPEQWQCRFSWRNKVSERWTGAWLHPLDYQDRSRVMEPADKVHWSYSDEARDAKAVAGAWDQAFRGALGPLPPVLHSACCAEYVVRRENVQQRPVDFYVHLRDWALSQAVPAYTCSRVLEHTWAMIFGQPPVSEALPECELLHCAHDQR